MATHIDSKALAGIAVFIALVAFASPYLTGNVAATVDNLDLIASDVTVPDRILAGVEFQPTFKVSNLGTAGISSTIYKYEILRGTQLFTSSTETFTIIGGKEQIVELPRNIYLPAAGTYTLRVTVDPYNYYAEVSEANNVAQTEFTVV
ncbi:MAG: hypothetical protein HY438_00170 [DPANN group archaeon]|nr:hypothetical protein [DPANN group archaeon]